MARHKNVWRLRVYCGRRFATRIASLRFNSASRTHTAPAETWSADAVYRRFGNSHNVAINPDSGLVAATGTDTFQGGLHFVDISNPLEPQAAGGMRGIGYAHDAQAVTYHGPDADYAGAELVFAFTVDSLTVVDASKPADAQLISRTQYPDSQYSHQGWLTEDHRFVLMDDELDEMYNGTKTRTHIWNVEDLDSPRYLGFHEFETSSIDHNLYIHEGRAYAANYLSGLRVLDLADIESGNLVEVASLDTHPNTDDADFGGAWSVYPFFESGNIILSDMSEGLVMARLDLPHSTLRGDYNGNGTLDSGDLDLLSSAIRNAAELSAADLNEDGTLDRLDRTAWVHEIAQTVFGDADLNGRFDSSDLTAIFQAGEYEDTVLANSTWATGDWNGDGDFDSSDLILALQDGGFQFDATSVHAVPEPSKLNSVCWALVIIGMGIRRREMRRN
ncbi:MAG: choice-of-anchor B family protein [Pirellulaceae bacterium]